MNEHRLAFIEESITNISNAWTAKFGLAPEDTILNSHLAARIQAWDKYVAPHIATESPAAAFAPSGAPPVVPHVQPNAGLPPAQQVLLPSTAPSTNRVVTLEGAVALAEQNLGRALTPEERASYERAFAPSP